MKSMKYVVSSSVILGSLLLAGTALAAEKGQEGMWGGPDMQGRGPIQGLIMRDGHASTTLGVAGVVASVNGNTLTVNALTRKVGSDKAMATTTYTVDASGATVFKNNATSTVASIVAGDTVLVEGAVSGTTVVAKKIRVGAPPRPGMMGDDDKKLRKASTTPKGKDLPLGNGQPVIAGNVTAVSGNTITITNKGGVTYTIDATNAKISKHGVSSATVANIVVGDSVVIQGTFNGTAVTATIVVDQGARPALNSSDNGKAKDNKGKGPGLMGAVGGFFSRIFGF